MTHTGIPARQTDGNVPGFTLKIAHRKRTMSPPSARAGVTVTASAAKTATAIHTLRIVHLSLFYNKTPVPGRRTSVTHSDHADAQRLFLNHHNPAAIAGKRIRRNICRMPCGRKRERQDHVSPTRWHVNNTENTCIASFAAPSK